MRPHDNRAWFLVLPALTLLALVGALPLLAVINYGFHDIFTLSDVFWVGPQWFTDILQSDRFLASLGRSLLFSTLALGIHVPLGIGVALLLLTYGKRAVLGLMMVAREDSSPCWSSGSALKKCWRTRFPLACCSPLSATRTSSSAASAA